MRKRSIFVHFSAVMTYRLKTCLCAPLNNTANSWGISFQKVGGSASSAHPELHGSAGTAYLSPLASLTANILLTHLPFWPSVADWGGGMFACCIASQIVRSVVDSHGRPHIALAYIGSCQFRDCEALLVASQVPEAFKFFVVWYSRQSSKVDYSLSYHLAFPF